MAKGSSKDQGPKSALELAFKAYQAGNVVLARKLAKQVSAAPSEADAAGAKKVGPELMVDRRDADAQTLANELLSRTSPSLKTFSLAGIAVILWGLLAYFASTRT